MFLKFLEFVGDKKKGLEKVARDPATQYDECNRPVQYANQHHTEKKDEPYQQRDHEYKTEYKTPESKDRDNGGKYRLQRDSLKKKAGCFLSEMKDRTHNKAILAIFAITALGIIFKPFFVSGIFIALGVVSRMHQRYLKFPIGIDLVIFGAVVCGAAFGPIFGAAVGVMAYFISVFYTDENVMYLPPALLGVGLVGLAAGFLGITSANIVFWGIALTLAYNILTGAIYFLAYKASLVGGFTFFVTHVWFNYAIFSVFGEIVMLALA